MTRLWTYTGYPPGAPDMHYIETFSEKDEAEKERQDDIDIGMICGEVFAIGVLENVT